MAKLLNLDELATEERVLVLKEVEYPMKEMTVDEFIKASREAEKADAEAKKVEAEAEKSGEAPQQAMSDVIDKLIEVICESFPTLPDSELRGLSLPQLNAIIEFMRGDIDKELTEGESEQEDAEKK